MIYVILKSEFDGKNCSRCGKILNRCDAWEADGENRMRAWIREHGWVLTDVSITLMGDMIMTVE